MNVQKIVKKNIFRFFSGSSKFVNKFDMENCIEICVL